jgi:agmatinase
MRTPYEPEPTNIDGDVAFLGIPWDGDSGNRVGTRYGPRYIRKASSILRPYNPYTDTNLQDFDIVDNGDVLVVPGEDDQAYENMQNRVEQLLDQDVIPAIAGGNHGITLALLRAVANEYGPVSLVMFDAHSDLGTSYFGGSIHPPGTFLHFAIEEDLIDPETSIRIGDRGDLYGEEYVDLKEDSGIDYYTREEIDERGVQEIADILKETVEGPTYATIDIDSIEPGFAPGQSVPQPGGLTPQELFTFIRRLQHADVVGFDHVEVCPPFDDPGNSTSILAAHVIHEALSAALA